MKRIVTALVPILLIAGLSLLASTVNQVRATPQTWIVDDNDPADFHAIQEAVNAAGDGDTILVKSGKYYENIIVKKSLSLMGESRETTIIDGNRTDTVFLVNADGVSIRQFTILNSGESQREGTFSGIDLYYSNNCEISNNTLVNHRDGIALWHSAENVLSNNICWNNTYGGNGIRLYASDLNVIVSNNVCDNALNGILLSDSNNNTVKENILSNNAYGIVMQVSDENTISRNNISESQLGIDFYYSNSNNLSTNIASGSCCGIYLSSSSNNSMVNNNLSNNTYGIHLGRASAYNDVTQSMISGNKIGMWIRFRSDDNVIFHNNFVRNLQQVLNDNSTNSWDDGYPLGGNFWSDFNGIDLNSGPYQNETGYDGMSDTARHVDGSNQDHYPLMYPFGPFSTLVSESYRDLLFRNAETEGFEHWVNELESGRMNESGFILNAMFGSSEYRRKWAGRLFVALMYNDVFEEIPSQEEYDYDVALLDSSALTWQHMLEMWFNSTKWDARFGDLNNTGFVTKLYRDMLHREPDLLELYYYVGVLDDGVLTRSELALVFYHCSEYQVVNVEEKLVYQLYLGLLRRVPEAEGYNYWVGELHAGASKHRVIDAFLKCPEYKQKHLWT